MGRILVFSPAAAIVQHTYNEAFFANLLRQRGHTLIHAGCDGILVDHCLAHTAYGLKENAPASEKLRVCRTCVKVRKELTHDFDESVLLESFATDADRLRVSSFVEEAAAQKTDPSQIVWSGIPVGRLAAYEFILHHKISDFGEISQDLYSLYSGKYLRNSLLVLLAAEKLLDRVRPEKIILYNVAYSINNVLKHSAKARKIPTAFIHAGPNREKSYDALMFSWKDIVSHDLEHRRHFRENYGKSEADYSKSQYPLSHLRGTWSASSVWSYSAARSSRLGARYASLRKKYRKVVLASLSSLDESYAADFSFADNYFRDADARGCFPGQEAWLEALLRYFSEKPEWALVVRLHPRDFKNRREDLVSAAALKWQKILSNPPPNVFMNHPEEKVSIYDLFENIDLHLVANSTTGQESAVLGIPTLSYVERTGNYLAEPVPLRAEDYFARVSELLSGDYEPNLAAIRRVLDWLIYWHTDATINFDSGGFWREPTSLGGRALRKIRRKLDRPLFGSYASYKKGLAVPSDQADIWIRFLEEVREVFELAVNSRAKPAPAVNARHYRELLAAVFETYLGVSPVGPDGALLEAPKSNRVAYSLAAALRQATLRKH